MTKRTLSHSACWLLFSNIVWNSTGSSSISLWIPVSSRTSKFCSRKLLNSTLLASLPSLCLPSAKTVATSRQTSSLILNSLTATFKSVFSCSDDSRLTLRSTNGCSPCREDVGFSPASSGAAPVSVVESPPNWRILLSSAANCQQIRSFRKKTSYTGNSCSNLIVHVFPVKKRKSNGQVITLPSPIK